MKILPTSSKSIRLACGVAALFVYTCAMAEPEALLVIKNHRFEPAELKVPAGQRVRLTVHNQDTTPEEFESHKLNREKVVPPGAKVAIFIGPLKPGTYEFWGEYNEATAKGVVVAE
ncbi:MAG: cupredoxin domain-containing protein [Polaromonas sp.]|nr:cupredoxin domain-containing protein [Polaromonas sp.]